MSAARAAGKVRADVSEIERANAGGETQGPVMRGEE
jgi:hypothetical protein